MIALMSPDKKHLSDAAATQPIPKKSVQIRTDKPRPHACSICTRGFARLEHLKRHERSHTNEKPFQCATCGRCFARRDLVLRHQQKLHLHASPALRRGSLPSTTSKASDSNASSPGDNIIFLLNNTSAKAPLPNQLLMTLPLGGHSMTFVNLASLSPTQMSPLDAGLPAGMQIRNPVAFPQGSLAPSQQGIPANANIPSPNTNSNNNTPSFSNTLPPQPSFSDLDYLQHHNLPTSGFIQQPSPVTGDSPDVKSKKRLNSAFAHSDFWGPGHALRGTHEFEKQQKFPLPGTRHASFSAISGLSYTNLQDAAALGAGAIDGPTQVGFSTPQFSATELENKGLSSLDLNGLDMDWQNFDFNRPKADAPQDPSVRKDKTDKFKTKLNTIPSETHLAGKINSGFFTNNIIASHQFLDPNHPHHIRGTTPFDFGYSPTNDATPDGLIHQGVALEPAQTAWSAPKANAPAGKQRASSLHRAPSTVSLQSTKRTKLGFVNEIDDLDWVEQIKGIPVNSTFPDASRNTGFLEMPYIKDEFQADEVLSLFKLRQDDLVKQKSQVDLKALHRSELRSSTEGSPKVRFTIGELSDFITAELRNRILEGSKISGAQFPPIEDLNAYMNLYGEEFNSYFLFIHMPTLKNPMVDNFENIPMILAMCAIGALYSYHDSNALLLFGLSKFYIHNFFENEVTVNKLQFKKVPIMAHQCLVLHIFISMFLNEPDMVEITTRQMNSMVGLIKSTNFHHPLEQFLVPPLPIENPNDAVILQNNFDYFVMAQTRIRTIHTFYQLEVMRSTLLGTPFFMSGLDIKCGTHCANEELWRSGTSAEWYTKYLKSQTKSIVELSNNETLENLVDRMEEPHANSGMPSLNKSLTLLMFVHEQVLIKYLENPNGHLPYLWRVNCRPQLEESLRLWESHFVANGGTPVITNRNHHTLNVYPELKLILPLMWLAKIRICVNYAPVTSKILHKDWAGMAASFSTLEEDLDGLKEASKYAIEILTLWIHNISVLDNAQQTSVRTPVFFLSSVFISVMLISKTLDVIEQSETISPCDRAFWTSSERVLLSIEATLSRNEELSYSEFLRKQSKGLFDFATSTECKRQIEAVCGEIHQGEVSLERLKKCKLSTLALGLGVRILADAPLWPLAMGFAEALKNLAIKINEHQTAQH